MVRKKSSFPGIPRNNERDPAQNAVTENIELLTGIRGNGLHRALLVKDLIDLDDMKRQALVKSIKGRGVDLPSPNSGNIERPHAPVNVTGTGGFTFIALKWDHPTYRGHAYAEIFRSETNFFSDAIRIATEVTDIFSDIVNMGAKYYYWVRFVNIADMIGPTQGANGIFVETQQSAEQILGEIGGLIERTHLGDFLSTQVDKIPELSIAIPELQFAIPPLQFAIPPLELAMFDADGLVQTAKKNALLAKESTESIANNLINAALADDLNWEKNSTKLIELEESFNDIESIVTEEFYSRTEANEAIAAAKTTLKVEIEESLGITISGDLTNTYYTKANADGVIALADLALKAAIEDPFGSSLGATLNNSYYTSVSADEAISAAGVDLKVSIEDPLGDSVGALLSNSYYTKASTDEAISQAGILLRAQIEDPDGDGIAADFVLNYYTKVDADRATAFSINELDSSFERFAHTIIENALANDLANNQRIQSSANLIQQNQTVADENKALSEKLGVLTNQFNESDSSVVKLTQSIAKNLQASTRDLLQLSNNIDNVGSALEQNYYTEVDADSAISQATSILQAAIEDPLGVSLGAHLQQNYYTKVNADSAVSNATTQLKSQIEDPTGNSLGADLFNNYYTRATADNAVASSISLLRAIIEDPSGVSVAANLQQSYYTKVDADSAVSNATTQLKTEIENPSGSSIGADLYINYYTKSSTDTAVSNAATALRAKIEDPFGTSVAADLQFNYYTKANTDSAISNATTQLKNKIEDSSGNSIGADLYNNYYTKVTADGAISQANTILQAAIEDTEGTSIGASLQTLSETVATNEGDFSALWGVKTTVAEVTASLGLVNDGVDPILAIKGAKFAVITEQDPTVLTPVFAVSNGQTVMAEALIDTAYIQSLVTDDLLSNRIVVGSEFKTPSINYNKITGARSQNFSMDPSGNIVAKSAVLESVTIKDAQGNVVMSSTGAVPYSALTETPTLGAFAGLEKLLSTNISTYIEAGAIGSAQIDQAYIATLFGVNATFSGTIYAENIEGDVTDSLVKTSTAKTGNNAIDIVTFTVSAMPFLRTFTIDGGIQVFGSDAGVLSLSKNGSVVSSQTIVPRVISVSEGTMSIPALSTAMVSSIAAGATATFVVRISTSLTSCAAQPIVANAFKRGSTLS